MLIRIALDRCVIQDRGGTFFSLLGTSVCSACGREREGGPWCWVSKNAAASVAQWPQGLLECRYGDVPHYDGPRCGFGYFVALGRTERLLMKVSRAQPTGAALKSAFDHMERIISHFPETTVSCVRQVATA